MQQFEAFLKLLENLQGKFQFFKMDSARVSFYKFSEHQFKVASKQWAETYSFELQHCLVRKFQSRQRFVKQW